MRKNLCMDAQKSIASFLFNFTAQRDFHTKRICGNRFGLNSEDGIGCGVSVGNLNVVSLMPRHQLVTAHTAENRMHDRPLRRGGLPTPLGFLGGQIDRSGASDVYVQTPLSDKDARPNDFAGLGWSLAGLCSRHSF